jgi:hypothetical protein
MVLTICTHEWANIPMTTWAHQLPLNSLDISTFCKTQIFSFFNLSPATLLTRETILGMISPTLGIVFIYLPINP